ncbi:hypothetical protein SAMN02745164_00842 [Marinitoga hydrogenitolerans DSM 16785]|uniref:Uncharacterized protein n=1 Tax=Marinitoga hydrogenitolerans (strain DSM 16785 / JCM 12826 / AT1271) TaxID=1122195 RepID=A0A1M4V4D5_MARH1|nr:hypothetical protein [Marinitoga hydrogenitolerans]SHE63752.1 hypothetical protein SAMN02745164_00842 [Marinitoga hydrogenitolerans DSM 16785]
MKKGFLILFLLIIPYMMFSETYYVIGNMVYKGMNYSKDEEYKNEIVSPEKDISEISDKRIIIIKDGVKDSLEQIYNENGNISMVDMAEIEMSGNINYGKSKIKLFEKSHTFSYFLPKDYSYWKIGGRREDENYMKLTTFENTIWYRIHKKGYSENNLYKDFELPYGVNSFVDFSAEIVGLVTKSKVLPEKSYSIAGIIFSFLNDKKESVDKISFVWSSSEYPFKEYVWINPMPLKDSKDFHISFNVNDIVNNKNVKYIRVIFWTFGSDKYKTLTADLWIRNVELKLSKAK